MSKLSIANSVVFVTGANRGIGKALVREALNRNARKVYAAARSLEKLADVMAMAPKRIVPVVLDVTDAKQVNMATVAQDVQILINNAGIANYTAIIAATDTQPARQEMEVNYFGLMNMTRAFAPILKKNGGGALVNISSVAGLVGIPSFGTYAATKAAVHSLTQSVRGELKAQGTFVAAVYPGPIDTDMSAGVDMEKFSPKDTAKKIFDGIEARSEEIYPDPVSEDLARKLKTDAKAAEREWSAMLPQPVEA